MGEADLGSYTGNVEEEDTSEQEQQQYEHPETLNAETPWIITQMLSILRNLATSYGWPCLIVAVVSWLLWNRYHRNYYSWQEKREEVVEAAYNKKNPEVGVAREMAIENARHRMQEKYDAESLVHAEQQRVKEEERRKRNLEEREPKLGQARGKMLTEKVAVPKKTVKINKVEKKKPDRSRSEYNPLMGSSGVGYRPTPRGGAAGGG